MLLRHYWSWIEVEWQDFTSQLIFISYLIGYAFLPLDVAKSHTLDL